ncbi:aminopeptidase M1-like isoform X3 [Humulus lupulus]|uniref:aminopeptidase M1-like isoform X3 n=1 Tax=Humulus lupulus TaxID=3486 RepID=UPI002B40920A|nr:aminopeptidase M1-like isoform X3 [Humulus lupulus]
MAVTQFEAVDARRCFPCWDEPALKATFKIKVDAPQELTVLSNMPIMDEKLNGKIKTVIFESPLMSTYPVGVVIGLFDYTEDTSARGVRVRVYCPVGKSDKGQFALDNAVKALDLYTKKLGWKSVAGESHFDTLLRGEVLKALVIFGHEETHREVKAKES